jgi:hypothetical protein
MTKKLLRGNPWHEGIISALAVGGFLIILALTLGLTPGIPQKIGEFFSDLTGVTAPVINGNMVLPAPTNPNRHLELYGALFNFAVGIAILQAVILAVRLRVGSPIGKTAETVGNLLFWSGDALVTNMVLGTGTLTGWFTFWAALIILSGLSLIIQFIIRIVHYRKTH